MISHLPVVVIVSPVLPSLGGGGGGGDTRSGLLFDCLLPLARVHQGFNLRLVAFHLQSRGGDVGAGLPPPCVAQGARVKLAAETL